MDFTHIKEVTEASIQDFFGNPTTPF